MNAATDTAAATSSRFGTFALVFGICFAILLRGLRNGGISDVHLSPGNRPHRSRLRAAAPRRRTGDVLVWLDRHFCARRIHPRFLGALLPEKIRGQIPLALAWVVPVALVPVVIYSLRFYWRW